MDGLTNIIAKIKELNDTECAEILENARNRAAEILAQAEIGAAKQAEKIKADTDVKVSVEHSKAESGADLEFKRAVLSKKSELVAMSINAAIDSIVNSSDDVYFGYIESLILSNALAGEGRLVFSERDKSRLPEGFADNINQKLEDGKKLSISQDTIDEYGFVIEYDEMKVDCSIKTLVEDNIDEIRDSLSSVLFA